MSGDDKRVVPGKFGEQRAVVKRGFRTCAHRGVAIVDVEKRTLECEACKAALDPIEWIADFAQRDDYRKHEHREARKLLELIQWLVSVGGGLALRRSGIEVRHPNGSKSSCGWGNFPNGLIYKLGAAQSSGPRRVATEDLATEEVDES